MSSRFPWSATGAALLTVSVLLPVGCSSPRSEKPPTTTTAPGSASQQPEKAATADPVPASAEPAPAAPSQPDATDDPLLVKGLRIPWKGDLDEMAKRRLVRVLVPFRRPEYFYMEGRPTGLLVEAFGEFEKVLNAKYATTSANRIVVTLLPTPMQNMREMMVSGRADIAAGMISITSRNQAVVDFSTPTATGLKILVVTGPGAPELTTVEDLSGHPVWVNPLMRTKDDIEALNTRLKAAGKAPAIVKETDEGLEPGDVLEMVNAGLYPITLMPSTVADFWAQVFSDIRVRGDLALGEDVELGWALRKETPQLKAFVDDFVETRRLGTSFGNTLVRTVP